MIFKLLKKNKLLTMKNLNNNTLPSLKVKQIQVLNTKGTKFINQHEIKGKNFTEVLPETETIILTLTH
jgi:hypothetical protein